MIAEGSRIRIEWPTAEFNDLHGLTGNVLQPEHGWVKPPGGQKQILALVQLDGPERTVLLAQEHLVEI